MPRKSEVAKTKIRKNIYNQVIGRRLDRVKELAAGGMTIGQIGNYFGITGAYMGKLLKDYPELQDSFDEGLALGIERATNSLMKQIDRGNPIATLFYLKCRAKWVEEQYLMNRYDPNTAARVQIFLPANERESQVIDLEPEQGE